MAHCSAAAEPSGRTFVFVIETALFYILIGGLGFLWMVWDKNKQTWHDKAAGSYVIRV